MLFEAYELEYSLLWNKKFKSEKFLKVDQFQDLFHSKIRFEKLSNVTVQSFHLKIGPRKKKNELHGIYSECEITCQ